MSPSFFEKAKAFLTFSKRLPYIHHSLSEDMTRNYYIVRLKVIEDMKNHEIISVSYIPFGESTPTDLLHLSSNLEDVRSQKDFLHLIQSISFDVPDTLTPQSIITVIVRW